MCLYIINDVNKLNYRVSHCSNRTSLHQGDQQGRSRVISGHLVSTLTRIHNNSWTPLIANAKRVGLFLWVINYGYGAFYHHRRAEGCRSRHTERRHGDTHLTLTPVLVNVSCISWTWGTSTGRLFTSNINNSRSSFLSAAVTTTRFGCFNTDLTGLTVANPNVFGVNNVS